jgi:hypothetical protein
MHKGIVAGWILDNDGHLLFSEHDIDALLQAGAQTLRFEFRLGNFARWERNLLDQYAHAIAMLEAKGIRVIGLIGNQIVPGAMQQQSHWNANAANGSNGFITAYVEAAQELAHRFPYIDLWEIWNEPNAYTVTSTPSPRLMENGTFIYPRLFATLLERTAAVLRLAHPHGATIISGGIFAHGSDPDSSGVNYLTEVYRHLPGKRLPCDGLGLHIYLDPGEVQQVITNLRHVMDTDQHKIYVTEAGRATPLAFDIRKRQAQEQAQAAFLTGTFSTCANNPAVDTVCWFCLRDNPFALSLDEKTFGMFFDNWAPKCATVDAFRALA